MANLESRVKRLEQALSLYQNDYALFDTESVERVKNLWLGSPDCLPYVAEVRNMLKIPDTVSDNFVISHHQEKIVQCFLDITKACRT